MRKLRELKQGVWYEIRTQINNREPLFQKKKALEIFDQVFRETKIRFVFEIRGWRLESDLLTFYIKPENGFELPQIMQWMKQTFAQRYNRWAGWTGHVWGDRYWSRILEGEPPGEPPEEEIGGPTAVSNSGVRPPEGKNEGAPRFSPISPHPATLTPG
ncbi:MAG: transposase [Treponema sp.]|jgi:REP element-mobilizing transposase RayT|nr:transposase [Treponema sp.]